eukprot:7147645-Prymnesium_polylepis.1
MFRPDCLGQEFNQAVLRCVKKTISIHGATPDSVQTPTNTLASALSLSRRVGERVEPCSPSS